MTLDRPKVHGGVRFRQCSGAAELVALSFYSTKGPYAPTFFGVDCHITVEIEGDER